MEVNKTWGNGKIELLGYGDIGPELIVRPKGHIDKILEKAQKKAKKKGAENNEEN